MEVTARPATPDDLAELTRLARSAVELQTAKRGGPEWARLSARAIDTKGSLESDLADEHTCVLVGVIDDVPLGYGVAADVELHDTGHLAVVSDLYVEPEARGVGLGEALMNGLVDWASARGCFGIDSEALPGDRHTKNFFESFGMVARALTVHRRLT